MSRRPRRPSKYDRQRNDANNSNDQQSQKSPRRKRPILPEERRRLGRVKRNRNRNNAANPPNSSAAPAPLAAPAPRRQLQQTSSSFDPSAVPRQRVRAGLSDKEVMSLLGGNLDIQDITVAQNLHEIGFTRDQLKTLNRKIPLRQLRKNLDNLTNVYGHNPDIPLGGILIDLFVNYPVSRQDLHDLGSPALPQRVGYVDLHMAIEVGGYNDTDVKTLVTLLKNGDLDYRDIDVVNDLYKKGVPLNDIAKLSQQVPLKRVTAFLGKDPGPEDIQTLNTAFDWNFSRDQMDTFLGKMSIGDLRRYIAANTNDPNIVKRLIGLLANTSVTPQDLRALQNVSPPIGFGDLYDAIQGKSYSQRDVNVLVDMLKREDITLDDGRLANKTPGEIRDEIDQNNDDNNQDLVPSDPPLLQNDNSGDDDDPVGDDSDFDVIEGNETFRLPNDAGIIGNNNDDNNEEDPYGLDPALVDEYLEASQNFDNSFAQADALLQKSSNSIAAFNQRMAERRQNRR